MALNSRAGAAGGAQPDQLLTRHEHGEVERVDHCQWVVCAQAVEEQPSLARQGLCLMVGVVGAEEAFPGWLELVYL